MHHFSTIIVCALGLASTLVSASPVRGPGRGHRKGNHGSLKFRPTGFRPTGYHSPSPSSIEIPLVTAAPVPTSSAIAGDDELPIVTVTVDPNVQTLTEEVLEYTTLTYTIGLGETARPATKTITKTTQVTRTVVPIYESTATPAPSPSAVLEPENEEEEEDKEEATSPVPTAVEEGCKPHTVTVTDVVTATQYATVIMTVTAPATPEITPAPTSSEVDSTIIIYTTVTTRV